MKYFLDTEFHEGVRKPKGWFTKEQWMIELISIGIVSEDGREYYAVSNEFDVDAAWNNTWLRDNVLKTLYNDLWYGKYQLENLHHCSKAFDIDNLKKLISLYGKSLAVIKDEVKHYIRPYILMPNTFKEEKYKPIEFYAYYADYDWVVLCSQLFGSMLQLPQGFPMYCKDIKQIMDSKATKEPIYALTGYTLEDALKHIKARENYPKNKNEHHALADAKFDRDLYKFLMKL